MVDSINLTKKIMKTLELEKMEVLSFTETQELGGGYGAGNGLTNNQQAAAFDSGISWIGGVIAGFFGF
jgi:hypothetical protein